MWCKGQTRIRTICAQQGKLDESRLNRHRQKSHENAVTCNEACVLQPCKDYCSRIIARWVATSEPVIAIVPRLSSLGSSTSIDSMADVCWLPVCFWEVICTLRWASMKLRSNVAPDQLRSFALRITNKEEKKRVGCVVARQPREAAL